MLAGPSECLVLADDTADAALVAADLLAQCDSLFVSEIMSTNLL
jgi:histidinol dehydrogenase